MPRSSAVEQLFRCFSHKCHDLFIQAIKNERMSRAIMQRVAQKINHLPISILSVLRRREKANKIHWVVSNSFAKSRLNQRMSLEKCQSNESSASFPPLFSHCRDLWSQHITLHSLRATAAKRGERHKKIFRSTFASASSWLWWGDYYVLDWKNSH